MGTVLGGRPPRTYYMIMPRVSTERENQALAALAAFFLFSEVPKINRDIVPRDRLGAGGSALMGWSYSRNKSLNGFIWIFKAICEKKRFVKIFDIHYG